MNILKLLDKLSHDKFFTTEASRLEAITQASVLGKKNSCCRCSSGIRHFNDYVSKSGNGKHKDYRSSS